jgi:hypothetical protein
MDWGGSASIKGRKSAIANRLLPATDLMSTKCISYVDKYSRMEQAILKKCRISAFGQQQ